jgi:hypothetical protein
MVEGGREFLKEEREEAKAGVFVDAKREEEGGGGRETERARERAGEREKEKEKEGIVRTAREEETTRVDRDCVKTPTRKRGVHSKAPPPLRLLAHVHISHLS